MKKGLVCFISLVIVTVFAAAQAFAEISVVSVTGKAVYKDKGDWQALTPGLKLQEGSKISTGVNSTAVINMNDHTVTIRPLTMMRIYESKTSADSSDNKIGLRRGSIRAKVAKKENVRTIFKVSTPVATSSVRGTIEDVSFNPGKGMTIKVIEGSVLGENKNGVKKLLSGRLVFHQKGNHPTPGSLLADVKKGAAVIVYDPNVTGDEKSSQESQGNDVVENSDGADSFLDAAALGKSPVKVTPVFPGNR